MQDKVIKIVDGMDSLESISFHELFVIQSKVEELTKDLKLNETKKLFEKSVLSSSNKLFQELISVYKISSMRFKRIIDYDFDTKTYVVFKGLETSISFVFQKNITGVYVENEGIEIDLNSFEKIVQLREKIKLIDLYEYDNKEILDFFKLIKSITGSSEGLIFDEIRN